MNFFYTHISKKAHARVKEVLTTSFISAGKLSDEFENELAAKLGMVNPICLNSGTSALHLGLEVAGIGCDDEVILPPQTFIASGLSILMAGAKPVFADIQYETGNIDPKSIEKKITEKTKAIMPVHWAGYPCDMDEISKIAKIHNLIVIEDAAHALGAVYKEKSIGSVSDYTCFSFQAIKHLTTGDGGALCCLNKEKYIEAKNRSWFGIDRENSKPSILGEREYELTTLGFKFHLNDYAAALGIANLEDISYILGRRREIAEIYRSELINIPGLRLLDYQNDRESAYWLFTILVENRIEFIKKLLSRKIPSSVVHLGIDKYSIFGGHNPGLLNQVKFDEHQVSIPVHSDLSDEDVDLIIHTIKEGW